MPDCGLQVEFGRGVYSIVSIAVCFIHFDDAAIKIPFVHLAVCSGPVHQCLHSAMPFITF